MGIMGVCLTNKALKEDLKDLREGLVQYKMWLAAADTNWLVICTECDKLREERDEARQLACEFWVMDGSGYSSSSRAKEDAIARGWDCFKEEEIP
jgi:hypothetical protein